MEFYFVCGMKSYLRYNIYKVRVHRDTLKNKYSYLLSINVT